MRRPIDRSACRSGECSTALATVLRREFFARAGSLATRYGLTPERLVAFCLERDPSTPLGTSRLIGHIEDLVLAAACTDDLAPAWSDLHERHESVLVRATSERFGADEAILFVRRWLTALRRSTVAEGGECRAAGAEEGAVHGADAPPTGHSGHSGHAGHSGHREVDHVSALMSGQLPGDMPGRASGPMSKHADPVLHAECLRAPSIAGYPGQQPLRHWLAQRLEAELSRHPHLPPGRRLRLTPSRFGVGFPSSAGS